MTRPGVAADVEAAVSEGHATVKVLAPRRRRMLLRLLLGMQRRGLAALHLNASTTADQMVLYTFSLKVRAYYMVPLEELHGLLGKKSRTDTAPIDRCALCRWETGGSSRRPATSRPPCTTSSSPAWAPQKNAPYILQIKEIYCAYLQLEN